MASTIKVDTIDTPSGAGDITISRPIVAQLTAGSIANLNNLLTPANASVTAAKMATTDTLPAWNGINLTALNANNLGSGTVSRARGGTGLTTAGASGQVLTSDGTNWTSAAAGGGAWTEKVALTTATGVTAIDLTNLTKTIKIFIQITAVQTDADSLNMRTSTNNGSSFDAGSTDYE